ncbi:hypothetical protein [Cupriavidus necator]
MTTWLRLGSVTELAAQAPEAQSWMTEGELARLAAMQSARRRGQFVAGRWLARTLLAEAFGGVWQAWTLTAAPMRRRRLPALFLRACRFRTAVASWPCLGFEINL